MVSLISSGRPGSWQIQHTLTRIRNRLQDLDYFITHIHREGNRPADHLAELGTFAHGLQTYHPGSASHYLLSLVRMDQLGYPSFRHR